MTLHSKESPQDFFFLHSQRTAKNLHLTSGRATNASDGLARHFGPEKRRNGRCRPRACASRRTASGGAVEGDDGAVRGGVCYFLCYRAPGSSSPTWAGAGARGAGHTRSAKPGRGHRSSVHSCASPSSFPTPFQRNGRAPLYKPPPAPHHHRLAPSRPPILSSLPPTPGAIDPSIHPSAAPSLPPSVRP